jgi:hypothetical protein
MRDFWLPNHKYELVDLLAERYPKDRSKFKIMTKKRLYAILYSVRKECCVH